MKATDSPSRDIAYRKRRVSILHNCAIPIRREVQERFSSASPTLDGSGMQIVFTPGLPRV